jgi:hypothetical protein
MKSCLFARCGNVAPALVCAQICTINAWHESSHANGTDQTWCRQFRCTQIIITLSSAPVCTARGMQVPKQCGTVRCAMRRHLDAATANAVETVKARKRSICNTFASCGKQAPAWVADVTSRHTGSWTSCFLCIPSATSAGPIVRSRRDAHTMQCMLAHMRDLHVVWAVQGPPCGGPLQRLPCSRRSATRIAPPACNRKGVHVH